MEPDRIERLSWLLEERHSCRAPFDPSQRISNAELDHIVDAARWAPTAHNMQNFMLVVVDDPAVLARLGEIRSAVSPTFITENYLQLSITEAQLQARRTGILGSHMPATWLTSDPAQAPRDASRMLSEVIAGAPMVIVVLFNPAHRAPASEHDVLGMVSLGCVLENMWLAAHACHLDVQVASAFAGEGAEEQIRSALAVEEPWRIAFAIRLGHAVAPARQPRVRRLTTDFVRRNRFA